MKAREQEKKEAENYSANNFLSEYIRRTES